MRQRDLRNMRGARRGCVRFLSGLREAVCRTPQRVEESILTCPNTTIPLHHPLKVQGVRGNSGALPADRFIIAVSLLKSYIVCLGDANPFTQLRPGSRIHVGRSLRNRGFPKSALGAWRVSA